MENLLVYIPIDRLHALFCKNNLPDRALGSALFADVKGFTPLTEALARELGPQRGSEELTHELNRVYGALIAEVHGYHGSVIGFSGDAITCWFDEDDGQRAVTCALAMQMAMEQFKEIRTPSGASFSLAIKVSVAAGPVRRFLAGNPQHHLMDVLAGQTLENMTAAEKIATRGEVATTEDIAMRYSSRIEVAEWRKDEISGERFAIVTGIDPRAERTPWPQLPPETFPEGVARPWLLPAVYDRLRAGQGEFLAELRPAAALFLKFSGLDYDREDDAGQILDNFVRWVQDVLAHYEGSLLQLTIGDKGSYLYAAFGAPVAHGDDTVRAVAAALALVKPPPHLQRVKHIQIGLARGQMRTGAYGSPARRTYGVLGDKVNLAARLMSAAKPGEIICEQEVVQTAGNYFAFEALEPVTVKGKSDPVLIYRPTGGGKKQNTNVQKVSIVGRKAERERLSSSLRELKAGKGQMIILEGEAGIGKTVLVDDFRSQAETLQMETLNGSGEAVEKSSPYYGWRGVFSQLFGLRSLDDHETQERQFLEQIQDYPELVQMAPLLNAVLPFQFLDNEFTSKLTGQARADSTRQLLVRLLSEAVRKSPRIIILEDAHWLDSLSWDLVVHLARTFIEPGAPLLFVLVSRPLDENAAGVQHLSSLEALETTTPLHLKAMDSEETVAVAESRLGLLPGTLPEKVAGLIRERSEGNPFFAEELVLTLRDEGIILVGPDPAAKDESGDPVKRCIITGDIKKATQSLPGNIQGLILARIDRLPPERQLTLKVAAVIGRTFTYTPLQYVLRLHTAVNDILLKLQLEEMAALDLTPLYCVEPELTYVFKHIITHEVAYETLLFAQRRELHITVAEWYEKSFPNQLDELAPAMAYHYSRAGVDDKALHYLTRAGERARNLYALKEAIDHFRNALAIADRQKPEKPTGLLKQINLRLGELLTTTGQYDLALDHLNASLDQAVADGDRDGEAAGCRWLARVHELLGEYPSALEWIQRGLDALDGKETSEATQLLLIAGLIHTRQGLYDEALEECQKGMRIAYALEEPTARARAYILVGHITRLRGQSAKAVEHFQQGLFLYQRSGDLHGQATSHNQIANAYFNMGQWRSADFHYSQARQVFGEIGDIYNRAFAENNLGGIALNQGRLDDALNFYTQALRALKQISESPYVLGVLQMNLGATFVRRNEIEAAYQHLDSSKEYFEQAQTRDFLPELHRHFAEAALQARDLEDAERQACVALALAQELNMSGEEGCARRVLGEVAFVAGDLVRANEELYESAKILDKMVEEYEAARSWLSIARLSYERKQMEEGDQALSRCQPVFERLEARSELAAVQELVRGSKTG